MVSSVDGVKCVAYISGKLWNIVQLFMGEHWTEVCVECVGHVSVGVDNLARGVLIGPILSLIILFSLM